MLRHRVHRLLVRDGDERRSACSASSTWSSFVANHSHIVALQIDDARIRWPS